MHPAAQDTLLAPFEGRIPPRPAWFDAALAQRPRRSTVEVNGCAIETLSWGDPALPGLLLLHGKLAHADWWSFIAPFFASNHHVVAMSFAGMGGSGWRPSYSVGGMADEVMAVARARGLMDGGRKPLVVAHSFGAFVSLVCAARHGNELAGIVTLDMPLMSTEQRAARRHPSISKRFEVRPTRVYATLEQALARFRFAPPQACENVFIADHIARASLKAVNDSEGGPGWTWRFDPQVALVRPGPAAQHLRDAGCPIAVAWGEDSALVLPEVAAYVASVAGPRTPLLPLPGARHHVMVDQPLALVAALRALFATWPPAR